MQLRLSIVLPLFLVAACDPQPSNDEQSNDEQSNDEQPNDEDSNDDEAEPCQPPGDGVPLTYTIGLVGFPEVEGDTLVGEGLDYEGSCLVDEIAHAGAELTLSLSCDHPEPSLPEGASVTITTAAAGLPAGVEVGDTLTFVASVTHSQNTGGDASGPILRALEHAANESYSLLDADGPVFVAQVNALSGSYGPIEVSQEYDCADFEFCDGSVAEVEGFVRATLGQTEVDVHVGEVGLLQSGDLAWDLSLFQARITNDCHGTVFGGFSIVRRP